MADKLTRIKGFADLFPPDSDAFTLMETAAREVFGHKRHDDLFFKTFPAIELDEFDTERLRRRARFSRFFGRAAAVRQAKPGTDDLKAGALEQISRHAAVHPAADSDDDPAH